MKKTAQGFSLIESLVGAAVLTIFFSAIAVMTYSTVRLVGESRVKAIAATLAQEKIEIIRNMPYTDVGTVGGVPSGVIEPTENKIVNNFNYVVDTSIVFVDDPFDGVSPIDTVATDYKRVRVSVTWSGTFASRQPLMVWTDVSPKGLETDVGGGSLLIQVIDSVGAVVSNADVTIDAPTLLPPVYIQTTSDNDGLVMIPGALECVECYKITVTKSGYTTDRTYGTTEVDNPSKNHLSVIEGDLTSSSFAIDIPSTVTYRVVRGPGSGYSPFQGVQMRVHGNKEIGRTSSDDPVYKYDAAIVSGSGGQVVVSDMEWDVYTVEIPGGSSVDFAGSWPFTPFSLLPNSSTTFYTVVEPAATDTLLVRVLDNLLAPVGNATVTLRNDLESFIATKSTALTDKPDRAQAYFNSLPSTLNPYTLTVSYTGYLDAVTEATVSGDVIEQLLLNPE